MEHDEKTGKIGTESAYRKGCRCDACKRASSDARKRRKSRQDERRRQFTEHRGRARGRLELDDATSAVVDEYRAAIKARDAAAARVEDLANRLKAVLGENEYGVRKGKLVLICTHVEQMRLNTALFKSDRPEIFAKYARPVVFRRLQLAENLPLPKAMKVRESQRSRPARGKGRK